jgi:hypothetical protein
MKARKLLIVIFGLGFAGCTTPRTYHGWVGGRYESHVETMTPGIDQQLATALGTTVTATQGDPSRISTRGKGGQIGLTEQMFDRLVTTIGLFYTAYDPVSYTFRTGSGLTVSETLTPKAIGADVSVGYNLWFFRPQLGYKYESVTMSGVATSSNGNRYSTSDSFSTMYLGGGLALDIPASSSLHLVTQGDYRVPLNASSGISIKTWTAQAGIRFGGWDYKP